MTAPLRVPVWLDCDPGHDDALAIILAGHSPMIDLLGISTVAGNQTVDKVTENARRILYAAGLAGVEVIQGQASPLLRDPLVCGEIHGESGLDGPKGGPLLPPVPETVPMTANSSGQDAGWRPAGVELVAQRIAAAASRPGSPRVRIVATGSLTNVALLLTLHPELAPLVEVVFMGGALGTGNTAPVAEFNMQVDPEAASVVVRSEARVTMVPLEVTHTALVTQRVAEAVLGCTPGEATEERAAATPFRATMYDLLHFFKSTVGTVACWYQQNGCLSQLTNGLPPTCTFAPAVQGGVWI